jgi:hypothetical protein
MSTTREVADNVARSFGFDKDGFVTCDPAALIDAIDRALQAERERAAKAAENALPIGADDCDNCERIRRIAVAIREGKPRE